MNYRIRANSWEVRKNPPIYEIVITILPQPGDHPKSAPQRTSLEVALCYLSCHFRSLSSIKGELWRFRTSHSYPINET